MELKAEILHLQLFNNKNMTYSEIIICFKLNRFLSLSVSLKKVKMNMIAIYSKYKIYY